MMEKDNQLKVMIDAKGKILGRLASQIANILRGKDQVNFAPNKVTGRQVVITNAKDVKLTGRKFEQKEYIRHTGWPGGLRKKKIKNVLQDHPAEVIQRAVSGMLPKNRLKKIWLKNLKIYKGEINE